MYCRDNFSDVKNFSQQGSLVEDVALEELLLVGCQAFAVLLLSHESLFLTAS